MKFLLPILFLAALAWPVPAKSFENESYDFLLAKLAADDGRYDEALALIDRVAEKEPENPVVLFERAMILIDAGRIERAETELRFITDKHPQFHDAHRILGRVLLERSAADRSRMEDALRHLQIAYKANPDDLSTGVTVSQLLVALNRVAEAERVLAALVERSPDQRVLNYNYAQVLTKLGRGDESRPYLERAVQLDSTFTPAIYQLVDIYQKSGEWEKAAEVLEPLVSEEPLNIELRRQQAFFYLRGGQSEKARDAFNLLIAADPNDTRSLFYLAEALNDLEEYQEAEKIYRRLLEASPNDPDLLASFGLTQLGLRNLDRAETAFRSLLGVDAVPDNLTALARTQLAYIALERGSYEHAVEEARPVVVFRDHPNNQAINIALEAFRKQKKFAEAAEFVKPLAEQFPADAFINARYVEMLTRMGDQTKASQIAATQAKLGTRNVIAATEALIQAGAHKDAIRYVSQAVEAKPDEADLLFELGSAHERAGNHAAAEEVFLRLLESDPDHAATLNYLGYMWAEANRNLDRAAEMLVRAVAQEPRNGAYIDSLGWVYYRQGKLDLAEKYLSDAARLLPRDATVQQHLADVLAEQGKRDRALELYRLALTLEPEPQDEQKIRSKLADLERQTQR